MSDYGYLKRQKMDELSHLVEDGELTEQEADEEMTDWEAGYGDYMYDQWKDRQLFGED